ncbi:hypothetical protein A628_00351 [Salmonella enterica subsp. enterica serovar Cubana str. 76814]|uniref:Uncharacterized protein n=1 Tax=Salmonella enterica subsp. enterica serovar Cubana str. 76814 TaxID=1192560 RepID=V7IU95_SALET|nr:hypothetical protein A628_00351 [Salmonella enterica subsp. enterica serovar Cubana str. 76814]
MFQHINPVINFYLTINQFYPLILKLCEAFHRRKMAGLNIIPFLRFF